MMILGRPFTPLGQLVVQMSALWQLVAPERGRTWGVAGSLRARECPSRYGLVKSLLAPAMSLTRRLRCLRPIDLEVAICASIEFGAGDRPFLGGLHPLNRRLGGSAQET